MELFIFFAYLKSATMGVGLGATPAAHLSERAWKTKHHKVLRVLRCQILYDKSCDVADVYWKLQFFLKELLYSCFFLNFVVMWIWECSALLGWSMVFLLASLVDCFEAFAHPSYSGKKLRNFTHWYCTKNGHCCKAGVLFPACPSFWVSIR